jgi:hypothetical protein
VFECRAGQHRALAYGVNAAQFIAQAVEPAGTVFIVQGNPRAHLFDVGGRVESVAFNGSGAAELAQGFADARLAATGNAHDDQGGDGMIHVTPQRADSATFASYDTSAKAEVADAFLSFFGLQHVRSRCQKAKIRRTLAHAFAAASRQRYLSALNFVWQAVDDHP